MKHLFRHLGDEQQLLRNPLIGPELLGGGFSAHEFRARIARAATLIRDEDTRLGRAERGKRQAACLMRCDLGSESVASLAGEFAISPRQLARERRQAWLRTLPHVLAKTSDLESSSIDDVVRGRAVALFRAGRPREAAGLMRAHIARSTPDAALFGLCDLAVMEYDSKRVREASATYLEFAAYVAARPATRSDPRLHLASHLLAVLLGDATATRAWGAEIGDLARRAMLQSPASPRIARTIVRLCFSIAQRFVHQHDYRSMFAVCAAIEEMQPSDDALDSHDAFSLHALRAINEWKRNGFNVAMEAHMLRALHLAVANGWTAAVAEGSSLLSSVYYLSGNVAAGDEYRDLALCVIPLADDKRSIAMTYSNLATAALDSGRVGDAARLGSPCFAADFERHPLLEHVPLLAAEIQLRQGLMQQGTASAHEVLRSAGTSGNQRLVAIAGRVVALGLEARGNRREAVALIEQSLELTGAGFCSKYDAQRIERARDAIAGTRAFPK